MMWWWITVHQARHKFSIPRSCVFWALQTRSVIPLKIWILHLCHANSISASNKRNQYIYSTLQCIYHNQRGKHLTSVFVFFQTCISCCLDHFSLFLFKCGLVTCKSVLVGAFKSFFNCFPWKFNATRPSSVHKDFIVLGFHFQMLHMLQQLLRLHPAEVNCNKFQVLQLLW